MTPTITALRERRRGSVAVELDGRAWRALPADAVVRAGLAVGRPLDRATARELGREVRCAKALAAATRSLAASDRSQMALEQRLAQAGHSPAAREEAIASLERSGLLDDARVAQSRAERLGRRGYGDAAIRADLRRRQLAGEIVTEAVAALESERDRVARLLEAKEPTPQLLRRLASRGFSRETLDEIMATFASDA